MIVCLAQIVYAPPTPHNVRGAIYTSNFDLYTTEQLWVAINDTTEDTYVETRTNAIGPPPVYAGYSATISGNDGDFINVTSWNRSNFGYHETTLVAGTTFVNVNLSFVRPSETNVTITIPSNGSVTNLGNITNVTANVSIIGGQDAQSCSATLTYENTSVFSLAPGEAATHSLGNINLYESTLTSWNVTTNDLGSTSLHVYTSCASDGRNFDRVNNRTAGELNVSDIQAPFIELVAPQNSSQVFSAGDLVSFSYNVTDFSNIANCSLIINGEVNVTNTSIAKNDTQIILANLTNATYGWSINCTDNSTNHNIGSSLSYNVSIENIQPPSIDITAIDRNIDLEIGDTKYITCNATITDDDNSTHINQFNATLFHQSSTLDAVNDNNDHYTNTSCYNVTGDVEMNVSCSFGLAYYANANNWSCAIQALDKNGLIGSATNQTEVNSLVAIEVTPSSIEFGNITPGENMSSSVQINVTNVGNTDFNITLDGYGSVNGDGYSVICDNRNVSVDYERFSVINLTDYPDMVRLSDTAEIAENITFLQRTNDNLLGSDFNSTYWRMGIPINTKGVCYGTVTFASSVG